MEPKLSCRVTCLDEASIWRCWGLRGWLLELLDRWMAGLGPEYAALGVGGSKRDSIDTDEADAVDPESLAFMAADGSSDFGLKC